MECSRQGWACVLCLPFATSSVFTAPTATSIEGGGFVQSKAVRRRNRRRIDRLEYGGYRPVAFSEEEGLSTADAVEEE